VNQPISNSKDNGRLSVFPVDTRAAEIRAIKAA